MADLLKALTNLNPPQWGMFLGTVGMVLSAVSQGFFGYQIVEGMNYAVFGVCAILFVVSFGGFLFMKHLDTKLRIEKLEQGLPPDQDKTVIGASPVDDE